MTFGKKKNNEASANDGKKNSSVSECTDGNETNPDTSCAGCEEGCEECEAELCVPEIEEQDEITKLKKRNDELLDKLQRNLAEFDNYRKRTIKEKASAYNDGVRDTVEKLLPVVDNFERALVSVNNKDDSFYKGIDMIYRQQKELLESLGVEEIYDLGEKFDPNQHFAVAHVEDEEHGESVIIEVMQKGYKYAEKIIRPAMVKVAN